MWGPGRSVAVRPARLRGPARWPPMPALALSGRGHSAGGMRASKRDVQLRGLVKVTVSFLSF